MEEKIILMAIQLLDNKDVKFTIDDIKNGLKISKKTVYKYFESKEVFAVAVFTRIIERAKSAQDEIMSSNVSGSQKLIDCLLEYMEIFRLISGGIFSLYCENIELEERIKGEISISMKRIITLYHEVSAGKIVKVMNDEIFKIIVEGILKNIYFEPNRRELACECLNIALVREIDNSSNTIQKF